MSMGVNNARADGVIPALLCLSVNFSQWCAVLMNGSGIGVVIHAGVFVGGLTAIKLCDVQF